MIRSPIGWSVFAALMVAATTRADTLALKGGQTFDGRFEQYRAGRFYFQPKQGNRVHQMLAQVESLTIEPPCAADVRRRLKPMPDGALLAAYRDGAFVFISDGKDVSVPAGEISGVEPRPDMKREMVQAGTAPPPDGAPPADPGLDLAMLLQPGTVTVIHFHMDGVVSSLRQGKYIEHVADQSDGRIRYSKVSIGDFDSGIARKYGIRSAPQFWVYDRNGQLAQKLIDRFTENDIDRALRSASR